MKRQEYNNKILYLIDIDEELREYLKDCIKAFPQQRFGQIICNYVCADYRSSEVSEHTKNLMNMLFPGNPDPFFEESETTFNRLKNG